MMEKCGQETNIIVCDVADGRLLSGGFMTITLFMTEGH